MTVFIHDCDACVSLGTLETTGDDTWWGGLGPFDLYACPQGGYPTVVARFGNEGPDYLSGLNPSTEHPALREATGRAVVAGLIPIDQPPTPFWAMPERRSAQVF